MAKVRGLLWFLPSKSPSITEYGGMDFDLEDSSLIMSIRKHGKILKLVFLKKKTQGDRL